MGIVIIRFSAPLRNANERLDLRSRVWQYSFAPLLDEEISPGIEELGLNKIQIQ